MEGVTGPSWLEVLTRLHWIDAWWTPFLRISTGVPRIGRLRRWLAPYTGTGLPVIAQLMGCDTEKLAAAAARLASLGAVMVDLNCACPSRDVLSSHAGGWRMRDPQWIGETLLAMREACSGKTPVSVKLRVGWDKTDFAETVAPVLNAVKPEMVTVHFRTVSEGYRPVKDGLARLRRIRESLPGLILYGSGDLFTVEDIRRMFEYAGVDGAAPARGLLRNPRLLADYAEAGAGGGGTGGLTAAGQRQFLAEIVRAGAGRGFVLQLASNFYGSSSPQFRCVLDEIAANGTIGK